MKLSTDLLAALAALCLSVDAIAARAGDGQSLDLMRMALGQDPASLAWLRPVVDAPSSCAGETYFAHADPARRWSVAGVPLANPGLVYKSFNDRLYAIEARLPANRHAYAKMLDALTRQYGRPDALEDWAGSPADSYIFQERQKLAAWFDKRANQNVWLLGHDAGGLFVVTGGASAAALAGSPAFHCSTLHTKRQTARND